ncbi:hypothetical protein [Actinomadura bangladeshensis]|uniref:Uncharacterized protein n=1 Tax=Actinomadura bangladeshensis TaxID=453573 RepID=A0A4R4N545_9ACTN|nr:hypothetical protein [Actinomadura bangladeshensis]TDC03825.1 hypothetical protein E1284_37700 [Actinomadura bangladeshensis]
MTDLALFDQVGEIIRGSAPPALGHLRVQVRHNGVKAWFGDPEPQREHYEAQVIPAELAPGARAHAVEIGFHAEYRDEPANQAVLARLLTAEPRWRAELGDDPATGPFLGRTTWRRISETWPDLDLDAPDLPFEIGVRLVDYIRALEPLRRGV